MLKSIIMPGSETLRNEDGSLWIEEELRRRFLAEAKVIDAEKGYISVPSVNQRIDLEMQGWVADLIANHIKQHGLTFDVAIGIPNSGIPLATSVAERLKIPLAPGRKGNNVPSSWHRTTVIEGGAESFTTGVASTFVFNGVEADDRVLAVEDVIAKGNTMNLIGESLQRNGNSVFVASYFAKLFQGGVERLRNLGINSFYTIGIEELYQEGEIWKPRLTPSYFSME